MVPLRILFLLTGLMACTSRSLWAQPQVADSLVQVLDTMKDNGLKRIKTMGRLCLIYSRYAPDSAEKTLGQLQQLSQLQRDTAGLILGHQLRGVLSASQGDYETGLESQLQALDLNEVFSQRDSRIHTSCLHNIAGILVSQNQHERAISYLQELLTIHLRNGDTALIADGYYALGSAYSSMGKKGQALPYLHEARRLFQKLDNLQRLAACHASLGNAYQATESYLRARQNYSKALEINLRNGDSTGLSYTYSNLGRLYYLEKQYTQAEKYLQFGLALSTRQRISTLCLQNLLYLAKLDSTRGRYEQAYTYFSHYYTLYDSIYNDNKAKQIAAMEARFERDKQARENDLLRREKALREREILAQRKVISNQRLLFGAFILIIILLIVLAYTFYRSALRHQRAEHQIRAQKEELAYLNQTKDQWFSIITHDFRSPLAFLQSALSLINGSTLSERETRMLTLELESRVKRTSNMLDNLLYWAQMNMEGIRPRPRTLDLRSILQEEVAFWEPQATRKGISLYLPPAPATYAWADRDMVQLVIRNLISNAIKFTPRQGQVHLALQPHPEGVAFTVQDTGQGIAPEHLAQLFRLNDPKARAGTSEEKGTGLGLWLCRAFIQANGGRIEVQSTPNEGTTFTVVLPADTALAPLEVRA